MFEDNYNLPVIFDCIIHDTNPVNLFITFTDNITCTTKKENMG